VSGPAPVGSRGRERRRTVLLALGSNIDPEANLLAALDELDALLEIQAVSAIYEAEPVGAPGTPRFLNAAVRAVTDLPLLELKFEVLRPIEARLGRTRGPRPNAPRTIDIDIVAADEPGPAGRSDDRDPGPEIPADRGLRTESADLGIPDPNIAEHAHLALPLGDVAPEFIHSPTGRSLSDIASRFDEDDGIRRRGDLQWPRS